MHQNIGRSSVFRKLLYSFLIMLILPTIVSVVDYYRYVDMGKKNALDGQEATLRQYQHAVDERLTNIQLTAVELSTDNNLLNLLDAAPSELMERYNSRLVSDSLDRYKRIYSYIDGMCIYVFRSEMIISNDAVFSPANSSVINALDFDPVFVSELIKPRKLFTKILYPKEKGNGKELFMLHSLPLWSTQSIRAMLGIQIKSDALLDCIELSKIGDGLVCLMNDEEVPLAYKGNIGLLNGLDIFDKKFIKKGQAQYGVCATPSRIAGLVYVSILPLDGYLRSMSVNRNIMIAMTSCIGIIGAIAAIILARRNFRPIGDLAIRLQKTYSYSSDEVVEDEDEVRFIANAIRQTFDNASKVNEQLARHMPMIRDNMIRELLRGTVLSDDQATSIFTMFGFQKGNRYRVLVMQINSYPATSTDERGSIIMLACDHAKRSFEQEGYHGVYVQMDGNRSAFVLQEEKCDVHGLCSVLLNIESYLRMELLLYVRFALGRDSDNIFDMGISFMDSQCLLDCQQITDNEIVLHDLAGLKRNCDLFYYPPQMEERLLNIMKTGDFARTLALVQEIYSENFEKRHLNLDMARCLFIDMVNTLMKNAEALDISTEQFMAQGDPLSIFGGISNISDMCQQMNNFLESVCGNIETKASSKNKTMALRMIKYLDEHFADADLCLNSIADAFALTPSYLSLLFKEATGKTFLIYLNQIRIDHADKLLRETNLSISDIAIASGYSNSNVFIRNYKKLREITPGEYRLQTNAN